MIPPTLTPFAESDEKPETPAPAPQEPQPTSSPYGSQQHVQQQPQASPHGSQQQQASPHGSQQQQPFQQQQIQQPTQMQQPPQMQQPQQMQMPGGMMQMPNVRMNSYSTVWWKSRCVVYSSVWL